MGYYSDVRVRTTQDGFEFLKKYVTSDLFGGYGYVEPVNDDEGVVFGWNDVKWYSVFHEVAEFENLLTIADEKGIPYEYVTLGEDNATTFDTNGDVFREFNEQLVHHLAVKCELVVWDGC